MMTSTMFGGRAHKIYGDKIVRQSYAPGFLMPLVLKDVRLALAEAEKAGAPMPSVDVVRDRLITGIARGHGDLDWTALGLVAAEEAGLKANLRAASITNATGNNQKKDPSYDLQSKSNNAEMEYLTTPLKVSRIALGTWAIGGWMWGGTDEKESIRTIHAALDRGINLIDTAPVYGFGRSEEIVGKALAQNGRRKQAVIATKVGLAWKDGNPYRNASKGRIVREVEDSLRRLQTDVIDIYQSPLAGPQHGDRGNRGSDGRTLSRAAKSARSV